MTRAPVTIPEFQPFTGEHCETVATGSLLGAVGVHLSEPMLFGLGEGLGFIFINLSSLPLPFVGGRVKPFALTTTLCGNLGVECVSSETTSRAKSWATLEKHLAGGRPVGLQLDCYHLEYFSRPVHFAGHFVAACGFDATHVDVIDTAPQGTRQRVRRENLEAARFAKGPMAAKARSWVIDAPRRGIGSADALGKSIRKAVRANARDYLSPAFQGASYLGIRKLAKSLPRWLSFAQDPAHDLGLAALLMEKAGTGGALFRNFYRDFLHEAREYVREKELARAHDVFASAAADWSAVASLIEDAGRSGSATPLNEAAALCVRLADTEQDAMRWLATL